MNNDEVPSISDKSLANKITAYRMSFFYYVTLPACAFLYLAYHAYIPQIHKTVNE